MYIDYNLIIENLTLEVELLKVKRDKAKLETILLQNILKQLETKKYCDTCEYYHKCGQVLFCTNKKHAGDLVQNYTVCDEWKEKIK